MKIGQEVYFVRELHHQMKERYDFSKPEKGEIVKLGRSIIHVKLYTTGVTHKFKMDDLSDASYTSHKLFLTKEDLTQYLMTHLKHTAVR